MVSSSSSASRSNGSCNSSHGTMADGLLPSSRSRPGAGTSVKPPSIVKILCQNKTSSNHTGHRHGMAWHGMAWHRHHQHHVSQVGSLHNKNGWHLVGSCCVSTWLCEGPGALGSGSPTELQNPRSPRNLRSRPKRTEGPGLTTEASA